MRVFFKAPKDPKSVYTWTCGRQRSITHEAPIAKGGFGEVHKMKNKKTGQVFARKIIRLFGLVTAQDIENEAYIISAVCSGYCRYVIEVFKHGWLAEDRSYYFIDMEYCPETLEDRIRSAGSGGPNGSTLAEVEPIKQKVSLAMIPTVSHDESISSKEFSSIPFSDPLQNDTQFDINWSSIGDILQDIISGLIYIHRNRIVHRDLKPRNVLFSERDRCWKLADFGSAGQASSKRLNTTHLSRGTESYRAPEVLENGRFNNRSDIFALGCIIFEIITGQKLFASDWAVHQYAQDSQSIFPDLWPSAAPGSHLYRLGRLTSTLLEIDPMSRPGAIETRERLLNIETGLGPSEESQSPITKDDFFIPQEDNVLAGQSSGIPKVQTGFRVPIPHMFNSSEDPQQLSQAETESVFSTFGSITSSDDGTLEDDEQDRWAQIREAARLRALQRAGMPLKNNSSDEIAEVNIPGETEFWKSTVEGPEQL